MSSDPAGVLTMHARATAEFDRRVRAVRADQWDAATPCTEWDVRALVNHLVGEQVWVPPLMEGATVAEVGDRFDGDLLGADPVRAWEEGSAAARDAFSAPGALERTVHLSYADRTAADYAWEMTADLAVHAWDLARGIGADDTMDPGLAEAVLARMEPLAPMLAASGMFGTPVAVPAGADAQTRLLGLVGRAR